MSAHDWPEFGLHPNPCYTENGNGDRYAIRLSRESYNYAKVRIDGYDALQQRCEELVSALNQCATGKITGGNLAETLNYVRQVAEQALKVQP